MEREIRKISVGGHEIELKTYVTYGESRMIENAGLSEMKMALGSDGQPVVGNFDAALFAEKAQNKAVEIIIVSFDGISEGILQKVLDLPRADGEAVVKEVEKVRNGLGDEKKAS